MKAMTLFLVVASVMACGQDRDAARQRVDTSGQPATAASAPVVADACLRARVAALDDVSAILARHAKGCARDADCSIVATGMPCQENCGNAILAARTAAFRVEIDGYASKVCPTLPTHCGISGVCAEITGARCVSGICRPVVAGTR